MNQNQLFKVVISIILLNSIVWTETVEPNEKDRLEILSIEENRRAYFHLIDKPLNYRVYGPDTLEVITRLAIPKKEKSEVKYSFQVSLDGEITKFEKVSKIYSKVKSSQHPAHGYTSSQVERIFIPKGKHNLIMYPDDKHKRILTRVVSHPEKRDKGAGLFIKQIGRKPRLVSIGDKQIRYYELSNSEPFQFIVGDATRIKVITRLLFSDEMGTEENYRVSISSENIVGSVFSYTVSRSYKYTIDGDNVVPGGSKSFMFELSQGQYDLKLLDEEKTVLIRVLEYEL